MERGCDLGAGDKDQAGGEAQICHSFTKAQLGLFLGIRLTKEEVYANVSRTLRVMSEESVLMFRLRGDIWGNMNAGGGDGIETIWWVMENSYEGKGVKRRMNPRKVVDLIFRLRDEAGNGNLA